MAASCSPGCSTQKLSIDVRRVPARNRSLSVKRFALRLVTRVGELLFWTGTTLPALCPVTGRAVVRQHAVRQSVVRRTVGFHAARWAPLNASSRLWRRWRRAVGTGVWWTTQQVGSRPTFLGVACADEALGRAFARELICGGRLWRTLRRRHLLFTITETGVEVWEGLGLRFQTRLSRMATEDVLPAARRTRSAAEEGAARRLAAWQRLQEWAAHHPWFKRVLADAPSVDEAVAVEVAEGKCLAVLGALEQGEAEELARAVWRGGHWSPGRLGDTVLVWREGCWRCVAEDSDAHGVNELEGFARGFMRQIAISDLHLGVKGRDTFGAHKEPALLRLLDEVIAQRATLVLNGDFLELMHESYGAIKRSYPEVFARLARVRRVIYLPGNHDEDVLRDRIKQVRRITRRRAQRHAYASVRRDEHGGLRIEAHAAAGGTTRLEAWRAILTDPRLLPWLQEVLDARQGSIHLSHGFADEGVAFQRLGPRDTPEERPVWYLDDAMLREPDPAGRLLKRVADRRQRLDRVISAEWGGQVQIVPYRLDAARGLYFEHGHAAILFCNGSRVGRLVSQLGGWLKRCGLTNIEDLVEERVGQWVRAIYPFGRVREMSQFIERALAVATWLTRGERMSNPALFFGHTHELAAVASDPVNSFTTQLAGARYGNTGAWSSRLRSALAGATRVEWLEWDGAGAAVRVADVSHPDSLNLWPAELPRPAAAWCGQPLEIHQ